jgi:hypothetical protein
MADPEVREVKSDYWQLADGRIGWEVRFDTLSNAGPPDVAGVADDQRQAIEAVNAALEAFMRTEGHDPEDVATVTLHRLLVDDPMAEE